MSWLAPAYLLGALAIGLPILFHLVRQRPRERMAFSSLMFLQPTPPRLTRRSRLDDLILLALRILVILLLAFAFTRPFFRSDSAAQRTPPGSDVLVLVDTSASMRQSGVWDQVQRHVRETLDDLNATDRVGLVAFDRRPRTLVDLAADDRQPPSRDAVEAAMQSLRPGWLRGDLALALMTAADQLDAVRGTDDAGHEKRLIVISDLQAEEALPDLQGFPWPGDVEVQLKRVAAETTTNASVSLLAPRSDDPSPSGESRGRRARVFNAAASEQAQFTLHWIDAEGQPLPQQRPISTNVPPGQTRVVRVPEPPQKAVALELSGDQQPFDNRWYVAEAEPQQKTLLFIGEDQAEPRESLSYYLQRAALDTPRRQISFLAVPPESISAPAPDAKEWDAKEWDAKDLALVVVAAPLSTAGVERLRGWLRDGVNVLVVLPTPITDPQPAERFLRDLVDRDEADAARLEIREADVVDYALLGDIDFQDPLFAVFADPRFSDFSKIRFWSHRRVDLPRDTDTADNETADNETTGNNEGAFKTLARFDDGSPALLRHSTEQGQLWVLTAGWQPSASQLALSTKFLPLLARMMDATAGDTRPMQRHRVGDPLPLAVEAFAPGRGPTRVRRPDGRVVSLSPDAAAGPAFDTPGLYQFGVGEAVRTLAFNLDVDESERGPVDADRLEALGVRLAGATLTAEQRAQQERQKRDVELEESQQWWRWLVIAALGVLLVESGWAAWRTRRM